MKTSVTLAFLLTLGTAKAQNWQLGGRAGLAVAGLTRPVAGTYFDFRLGVSAGMLARRQVGQHVYLQPELLYTLGGYRYDGVYNHAGNINTTTLDLHYLALPLLAGYEWHGAFVELGPQLSWLLRAQERARLDDGRLLYSEKATPGFPRAEAGAVVGVGWYQRRGLLLGLRYTRGFTKLQEAILFASNGYPASHRLYNQSFQLYAGYVFKAAPSAVGR